MASIRMNIRIVLVRMGEKFQITVRVSVLKDRRSEMACARKNQISLSELYELASTLSFIKNKVEEHSMVSGSINRGKRDYTFALGFLA